MDKTSEELLIEHAHKGTWRYLRARRFAGQIMHLMQDFVPQDRMILRHIEDYLLKVGFEGNVELLNVPPEKDELDKLQLERAMIETHPLFVDGLLSVPTSGEK